MTTRAVIYSRVSTPEQAEDDKISLIEQERLCREYCQNKGYSVVLTYQDIGSGTTKKRPSFLKMLGEARMGIFDIIIAWKTDRLARGIYPCSALMEAIEESGTTIETVAEPFDRTTFEIRAVLGRIEVENIVQRTTMGREARMRSGHHHVKAAYGYDYDSKTRHWVINETEAKWVAQIFRWYIEGLSPNKISQRLNAEGVPTKLNSKLGWAEKTVSDMVCQEFYAGRCLRNIGRHNKKKKSPEKWIHIPAPSIISEEEWAAAKARRSQNIVRSQRNTKRVYITQHVLECEECGTKFHVADGWTGNSRIECFRMMRYPHSTPCRLPKTVDYEKVAGQLWHGIVEVVGSEEGLEAAVVSNVNRVKGQKESIEQRLKEITAKRDNLATEQDTVISWARKRLISEEQMERQVRAMADEDAECAAEQNRLLADLRLIGNGDEVYQQARQIIPMMKARINDKVTEHDKLEIVNTLVRRARLDGAGNLSIEFKTPRPVTSFGYVSS